MYERNERQGPCILFWLETAKKDRLYKECLLVRQKAVHCLIKKNWTAAQFLALKLALFP